jgi:hypothetical protein
MQGGQVTEDAEGDHSCRERWYWSIIIKWRAQSIIEIIDTADFIGASLSLQSARWNFRSYFITGRFASLKARNAEKTARRCAQALRYFTARRHDYR